MTGLKKTGGVLKKLCFIYAAALMLAVILFMIKDMAGAGKYLFIPAACLVFTALLALICAKRIPSFGAFPVAVFALRFAIAGLVIAVVKTQPTFDFKTMFEAAKQLASGSHDYLDNTYYFTWAYQTGFVTYEALVVKIFGTGLLPQQLLNAVWMAGSGCLVYFIGRLFLPEKPAKTAAVLYSLYPGPYFLASSLTNQHLGTFLFLLGVYILFGKKEPSFKRAALSGAVLALGNVMRPLGIIVILALAALWLVQVIFIRSCGWKKATAVMLTVTAAYFGIFYLYSWLVIATGTNPYGLSNNLPQWKFLLGLNMSSNGMWTRSDYNTYYLLPYGEAKAAVAAEVQNRLRASPGEFIRLFARKLHYLMAAQEDLSPGFSHIDASLNHAGLIMNAAVLCDNGFRLAVSGFAFAGLVKLIREKAADKNILPFFFAVIISLYCTAHFFIEVQQRYRYFVMPFVFLLAGTGIAYVSGIRGRKESQKQNAVNASPPPETGGAAEHQQSF